LRLIDQTSPGTESPLQTVRSSKSKLLGRKMVHEAETTAIYDPPVLGVDPEREDIIVWY
jgi:hypothetical protein